MSVILALSILYLFRGFFFFSNWKLRLKEVPQVWNSWEEEGDWEKRKSYPFSCSPPTPNSSACTRCQEMHSNAIWNSDEIKGISPPAGEWVWSTTAVPQAWGPAGDLKLERRKDAEAEWRKWRKKQMRRGETARGWSGGKKMNDRERENKWPCNIFCEKRNWRKEVPVVPS